MQYVYYCPNCNNLECHNLIDATTECSECGKKLLPLKVSMDEWNAYSNDEMLEAIEKAKNNALKKPVFKPSVDEEEQTEPNNNLMKCPDCGKVMSKNAITCPNCGYYVKDNVKVKDAQNKGKDSGKACIVLGIFGLVVWFMYNVATAQSMIADKAKWLTSGYHTSSYYTHNIISYFILIISLIILIVGIIKVIKNSR